jgi:hypothetical protein
MSATAVQPAYRDFKMTRGPGAPDRKAENRKIKKQGDGP